MGGFVVVAYSPSRGTVETARSDYARTRPSKIPHLGAGLSVHNCIHLIQVPIARGWWPMPGHSAQTRTMPTCAWQRPSIAIQLIISTLLYIVCVRCARFITTPIIKLKTTHTHTHVQALASQIRKSCFRFSRVHGAMKSRVLCAHCECSKTASVQLYLWVSAMFHGWNSNLYIALTK